MIQPDDVRMPRSTRFDVSSPRASSENNRPNINPPDLRSLTQDSPPRKRETKGTSPMFAANTLTAEQTTELFQKRLAEAQQHNEQVLDKEGVTDVLRPKVTLDLGSSSIARLPEAVIDLIKDEVDRLALSYNQIWHIPLRVHECTHLRYLNIRNNVFREIPRGVYKLPYLEILDISRNKVKKISREIRSLSSLRVLSITDNKIDELPTELCEMNMLELLRIRGNPLKEKLKKVIEAKEAEVSFLEMNEQEREKTITAEIKRHLRASHPVIAPIDVEAAQQFEEPPMETPRPAKRIPSSRFPVIPSTGNSDGSSPPNMINPPPIPTRSHFRMTSGQGMAIKRPGIAPLISSDRIRSSSDAIVQNPRAKRMGMLRNKAELDSIEESRANRNSHLRGFSHASALKRGGALASPSTSAGTSSPNSPRNRREQYVRRLSSLPEHKVESEWQNPVVQGGKGILYALYQVHPQISGLLAAVRGRDGKRSSLEVIFFYASTHVDRLNESLELADAMDPDDAVEYEQVEERIKEDCAHCITAYSQVASRLQDSMKRIIAGSDPRYVRTLMLLLYGSVMELRNAISGFGFDVRVTTFSHKRQRSSGSKHPIQTIPEEFVAVNRSATPTREGIVHQRPGLRLRSDTTIQHPPPENLSTPQPTPVNQSMHLTGTTMNGNTYHSTTTSSTNGTTVAGSSYGSRSRSNSRNTSNPSSMASSIASTPRSNDGFHLPRSTSYFARINPSTGLTESQEEALFGQIFMSLTRAYEAALQAVPTAREHFSRCLDASREGRQTRAIQELWTALVYRCKQCYDVSEALQMRLTSMRIKDEGGRNDPSFWLLCKTFLQSFVELVTEMKELRNLRLLPQELILILRPVQKTSREAGRLIEQSPWRALTDGVTTMPAPTPYTSGSGIPPPVRSDSFDTPHLGPPVRSDSYSYMNGGGNGNGYPVRENLSLSTAPQHPQLLRMHTSPSAISSAPAVQPLSALPPDLSAVPGFDRMHGPSPLTSPLPATPLSAALGPAAQATIPTSAPPTAVPTSANPINLFRGDVFQRADALLSSTGSGGTGMNWSIRR
ncbi:uncharacterized protein HMPREF1541_04461 [Cyphellophora europaea CBS 101466]|uniref:Disease resistance R13L4/SHOC-2-like LRR domain-containing protein n=1 Tax=Cyphellophora europaea (strain CBS 101466) TaxID=1220924 RepID=W2RV52_CYPE1|nr:uncharacterized protein HMPREF1541_04461 [Cyphellophora europaea CBS 101466]ETN40185.1 hypothetical protein HMPREF1541_04461 [Cyphellophora europaea CBS 101466]